MKLINKVGKMDRVWFRPGGIPTDFSKKGVSPHEAWWAAILDSIQIGVYPHMGFGKVLVLGINQH